ncbi:uncharacterized protein LOC125961636 [Orcinus orca]|uniref:uncharacterized protein LOC125961636 n=1 Tax=Orcinus orca TaxID=9733 RepID=UPI002112801E|nr:uncharacterized protein LOC125961636 [Orcinus orca]
MDVAFKPVHAFHCYHEHAVVLFCFLPSGKKKVLAYVFPFRVYTQFSFCLHHSLGRRQRLLTYLTDKDTKNRKDAMMCLETSFPSTGVKSRGVRVHHLKIIPPEPASERSIQAISSQPICDLLNLQMGITRLCWTKGRSTRLESNFSCQNIGLIHGFWILTPSQFDSHLQGAQMACGSDGLMRRSLPSQCERHRWSEEHRHNRDKVDKPWSKEE